MGDVTTEAAGSVPSQRCWRCLSACSRGTSGNVLYSDSWAWQQLPQQHDFFLWIGQMQVSSQDSSFPWLCSCSSADWKGRSGPLGASPSEGLAGAGYGALTAAIPAPALDIALPMPSAWLCQREPANITSQWFHPVFNGLLLVGSCRDNPCSLWLG